VSASPGLSHAAKHPALVNFNGGRIFIRDVKTTGYQRALSDISSPDFAAAYRVNGEDKPQYRLHNDNYRVFKGLREFRQLIMVFLFTFPFRSALP
jgi:mRNA-degrading endonuclease RelE of RelBE toxin-antitoxin system